MQLAVLEASNGDVQAARTRLASLMESQPHSAMFPFELAVLEMQWGNPDRALALYATATQAQADDDRVRAPGSSPVTRGGDATAHTCSHSHSPHFLVPFPPTFRIDNTKQRLWSTLG